jgi:hypothetical protein
MFGEIYLSIESLEFWIFCDVVISEMKKFISDSNDCFDNWRGCSFSGEQPLELLFFFFRKII